MDRIKIKCFLLSAKQVALKNKASFLISTFSFFFFPFNVFTQQVQIDIDENAQNRILSIAVQDCDFVAGLNRNQIKKLESNNQIPAFGLYQNQWDTLFIRSEKIEIPFFEEQIKILLIQDGNSPFIFPISSVVSTGFIKSRGKQHTGVDFAVQKKEPVVACFDGVVRIAQKYEEYGNTVVIRHYNGLETLYALLDQVNVISGQKVHAGELLGYLGTVVGKKSALHFETRFFYELFNPEKMINFSERRLQSNILTLTLKDFIAVPVLSLKQPSIQEELSSDENLYKEPEVNDIDAKSIYHIVEKGETIYRICTKYNISAEQLKSLNKIRGDTIEVGQKLRIK
jgi:murein DD-endopeptidase MepM/ murein hydrolase activator NlpD